MLCDKFSEDKSLNKTISNILGGNMKIVEDYAQRVAKKKVDESKESIVINLCEEGFKIADIARIADVSKDFVKKKHYPNNLHNYLPNLEKFKILKNINKIVLKHYFTLTVVLIVSLRYVTFTA